MNKLCTILAKVETLSNDGITVPASSGESLNYTNMELNVHDDGDDDVILQNPGNLREQTRALDNPSDCQGSNPSLSMLGRGGLT